jgi:hypothetical protein
LVQGLGLELGLGLGSIRVRIMGSTMAVVKFRVRGGFRIMVRVGFPQDQGYG